VGREMHPQRAKIEVPGVLSGPTQHPDSLQASHFPEPLTETPVAGLPKFRSEASLLPLGFFNPRNVGSASRVSFFYC
jgi:hypothetical protein